jgi:hypothetical protein
LFGLELQTSQNLFLKGVQDRDIAYRHESGLVKIEGDETIAPGAESELEFVTAACQELETAQKAIEIARILAAKLAVGADSQGMLEFKKNDEFMGGKWLKGCTIKIGDPGFAAQPQATVGVPLHQLRQFIEKVLPGVGEDGKRYLNDLESIRELCGLDLAKESPDLVGFLTACHFFLTCATWNYMPGVTLNKDGKPGNQGLDPDFWRVCTIPSDHVKTFGYLQKVRYWDSSDDEYFLDPDKNGAYRLLVCRDSPKSMFKLLHRTDFYSMFHALPSDQQARLQTQPGKVSPLVWPVEWTRHHQLFVYPYRADPPDPAARAAGLIKEGRAEGWAGTDVTAEDWWLTAPGPTLENWWASVMQGWKADGGVIPKDLASPPPGIRGRNPDKLAIFPGDDENKREYYGMGAFPMDRSAKPPLAVYEHRAFSVHPEVKELRPLTMDKWPQLLKIFYANFVPKS